MYGFAILLAFHLLGVLLEKGLHIPLPGNVIGLILFTTALACKWIKMEWVEPTSAFLLKHMMVFFAPVIVGVMAVYPLVRGSLAAVGLSLVLSTLIALAVAGWVTQAIIRKKGEE